MSAGNKRNDENVVKRKSYYSFAKRYPGSKSDSGYLIGDSKKVKRKENIKKTVFALVLVLLFVCAYVAVSAAMYASEGAPGEAAAEVQTTEAESASGEEATTFISGEATEQ